MPMKFDSKYIFIPVLITTLLFFSCQKQSEISREFKCESVTYDNLENNEDVQSMFSIEIPENWKTNLYQDEIQSSIFTADTTKQLTETVLLDVTYIQKKIEFNEAFLLQQEQESLSKGLINIKSKALKIIEKPTLYLLFKGKKGKFDYHICNAFIKVNESNFILAKTEVYGDTLINQRFCKALSLINNIKLKNK